MYELNILFQKVFMKSESQLSIELGIDKRTIKQIRVSKLTLNGWITGDLQVQWELDGAKFKLSKLKSIFSQCP